MDADELRQDIVDKALDWDADPVAARRNALRAAVTAYKARYKARRFFVQETAGEPSAWVFLYDAGMTTEWCKTTSLTFAQRLVAKLNEQLDGGWNPNA